MSEEVALKEVHRIMTICNACRYCEGFCAVWPAMELHRSFKDTDLKYIANLCHNCRGCYYACQYAPPHEFKLNAPQALCALRAETYQEFASPKCLSWLFAKNAAAVFVITLIATLGLFYAGLSNAGLDVFFGAYSEPGSFYNIIPYGVMLVLFTGIFLLAAFSLCWSVKTFWKETNGLSGGLWDWKSVRTAVWDCLTLRYLEGGGEGCNYPDDRFSMVRRYFHHALFYGFMLCLASTSVAFLYDHLMGWPAPYGPGSLPVMFGTLGGIALCIGTGGMLWLKKVMDPKPAYEGSNGMDRAFTLLLFLVSLSGLLLLFMRSTSLMGVLLCLHLGLVLGFFLTMPFGKFVHVVYRYAALVRNATEQREGKAM